MTYKKQHPLKAIALIGLMVSSFSGEALAGGFGDISGSIGESVSTTPLLFSIAAYLVGAAFIVFGTIRLKYHVDSPANMPLKNALGMLFIGACLISLPVTVEIVRTTLDGGADSDFGDVFDNLKDGIGGR